jgi:O-methyltransferase
VNWRKNVNEALVRTTGHRFVKARKPQRRRPPLRRYWDDEASATMTDVKPWSMVSYDRLFALIVAVRYVVDHAIPGDFVECGVWRGGAMQAVAKTLLARGVTERDLHLFDTFEGMPPPTEEDRRLSGRSAQEVLDRRPRTHIVWAIADLDDVRAGMSRTGYPAERVHYHPGLVEDTIPEHAPERIALLRLDTDWYESTRHELAHLYDRLTPGGVLIVDDYDFWEGSRQAVDEFVAETGARLLLAPVDTSRVAVKA